MLKVQVQFSKVITDWNHKEGAGSEMHGGCADYLDFVKTINSVDEVETLLKERLEEFSLPSDYFHIIDNGTIGFNTIESNSTTPLSAEEQVLYHEQGHKMFLCDYTAHIKLLVVNEPNIDSLRQMFPNAEY